MLDDKYYKMFQMILPDLIEEQGLFNVLAELGHYVREEGEEHEDSLAEVQADLIDNCASFMDKGADDIVPSLTELIKGIETMIAEREFSIVPNCPLTQEMF